MKRILFSLILSLPISMVAVPSNKEAYRREKLELERNAQCAFAITKVTEKSPDLAEKICASYKGKTGEYSSCALMCQFLNDLRMYRQVYNNHMRPSP